MCVRAPRPAGHDLNDANHAFLRRCIAPAAGGGRTVVCAVGDRAQAIYQFRGAHPEAMDRFRDTFGARALSLSCCFRCPRRVVAVARCLHEHIKAAPQATLGCVRTHVVRPGRWAEELRRCVARAGPDRTTMFVARSNATILEFVRHLLRGDGGGDPAGIRWAAPALAAQLTELLDDPASAAYDTLLGLRQAAETGGTTDDDRAPVDRAVLRLLDSAMQTDGPHAAPATSPFLTLVRSLLQRRSGQLVLATIHGAKGAEHDNVVVHQYNLLGMRDPGGVHTRPTPALNGRGRGRGTGKKKVGTQKKPGP